MTRLHGLFSVAIHDFHDVAYMEDLARIVVMNTIQEIEQAIRKLDPLELAEFRKWYFTFDADAWDEEIRKDAESGKLDFLIDEAREDLRRGRVKNL